MTTFVAKTLVAALLCAGVAVALPADASAQSGSSVAPTIIPVSGRLLNPDGSPRTGPVTLILSLYNNQTDAAPRWVEQHDVVLDPTGAYSVQFGSTLPDGLPSDLFANEGGARWLGVAVRESTGDVEQPRVMLVSVPYAAKAASAETLGGRAVSDFVLSSTFRQDLETVLREAGVGGGEFSAEGIPNRLAKYDGAGNPTADSVIYDDGANIGIGTNSPQTRLHIAADQNFAAFRLENTTPGTGANWQFTSASDGQLRFTELGAAVRMAINKGTGFVGIGTQAPEAMVHIAGIANTPAFRLQNLQSGTSWQVTSSLDGQFRITELGVSPRLTIDRQTGTTSIYGTAAINGNATITGNTTINGLTTLAGNTTVGGDMVVNGNIGAKYQDVAEWVDAAEPLENGTVVVIDPGSTNKVRAARSSYATSVAGAISPQPGLILGEGGEGRVLVAQSGRVKVKADATFGAIKPGDLLVTSPTPGHVMKSKPVKLGGAEVHRPGTLVGKALEALPDGRGEILVLLTLQ